MGANFDMSLRPENIVGVDLESCKTYDVLESKEYFGYRYERNNPARWICKRLQYNANIRLIAGMVLKRCFGLFNVIREKHLNNVEQRRTVEQRRKVHVSCSKEQATILSKMVHATTVKTKSWWRPPFRPKWRAHDLDIPLQRRVDAVDGLTDDDDNTDEECKDLEERFSVVNNLMMEVHDRLTRMPEIKPAVTVSPINCQHVVIGEMLNRHCSMLQCDAVGHN